MREKSKQLIFIVPIVLPQITVRLSASIAFKIVNQSEHALGL